MKNHTRWYIAVALFGALLLAGCASATGAPGTGTPTVNLVPGASTTQAVPGTAPTTAAGGAVSATDTPAAGAATTVVTPTESTALATPTTSMAVTPTQSAALATPTSAAGSAVTPLTTPTSSTSGAVPAPAPGAGTPTVAANLQPIATALNDLAAAPAFCFNTTVAASAASGGAAATTGNATGSSAFTSCTQDPNAQAFAQVVPPDSVHLTTAANEVIVINNQGSWQRSNGGQWQKLSDAPGVTGGLFNLINSDNINQLVQSIDPSSIQNMGNDTLNGMAMNVYHFTVTGDNNMPMFSGPTKVWIGQSDGKLYQVQSTATASTTMFGVDVSAQAVTTNLFSYPTSLTIQPPM